MKITPIFHILSILIMPLSGFMMVSGFVDFVYNNQNWINFFISATITLFVGMSVFLATRGHNDQNIDLRQAFVLTTMSWITIAFFGALPFYLSNINLDFTDSFFESMSGITTTGSTILINIEGFTTRYIGVEITFTMAWRNWSNCYGYCYFSNAKCWRHAII